MLIATRLSPNLPEVMAAAESVTLASVTPPSASLVVVTAPSASLAVVTAPSARKAVGRPVRLEPSSTGSLPSPSSCTSWVAPLKMFPWVVSEGLLVMVGQSAPSAQAAVELFRA